MALTPDDVKKIVDSKIGGMTLKPAPTTFIEGRMVTPQIPTICSAKDSFSKMASDAGKALGEMKDAFGKAVNAATGAFDDITKEISGAIGDALTGVKQFIINPIQAACSSAMSQINAAIADLTAKMNAATDPTLKAALAAAIADLNGALTSVTGALNQAASLIGEKFEQVLAAMSMCKPEQMPGIKQYKPTDFTQTLDQQANIDSIRLKVSSIQSASTTLVASPTTANYNVMSGLRADTAALSSTVTTAVNSDVANLAGAQAQNDAMGKFMQMANGLNDDNTSGFIKQVSNPDVQGLLGRAQVGLANAGKVAGE